MFATLKVRNGFRIWNLFSTSQTFKLIKYIFKGKNELLTSIYDKFKAFQKDSAVEVSTKKY
jgi:hypothetical protein